MSENKHRKQIAIQAAYAAGGVLQAYRTRALSVEYKGTVDPVTDADRAAEAAILEVLHRHFPNEPILSEEGETELPLKNCWIVDPLDGTTNFSRGYPLYGPSIAWVDRQGRVQVGVVYNPLLDELFWAVRGGGAWCNQTRLHVSQTSRLERALISSGTPYDVQERVQEIARPWLSLMGTVQSLRQDGSAALDLAHVAAGRTDAHFEAGLEPWDVAGGVLLVEEAGGHITTYENAPFTLAAPTLLACNARLHKAVLRHLG